MIALLTLLTLPAWANGGFVSDAEGSGAALSAEFRAVYVVGEEETTAVIQSGVATSATRFAWILPVPAPIRDSRIAKVSPEAMGALIDSTDPRYHGTWTSCGFAPLGIYGCASDTVEESGDAGVDILRELAIGPYQILYFDASAQVSVSAWLREQGYLVPDGIEERIDLYLAEGWTLLAIELVAGELPEEPTALPALAFRYADPRPIYPIRISALSSTEEVETLVFTISPTPSVPKDEPWVLPELANRYLGADFRAWYLAQARAAAEAAGPRAWVLEYNLSHPSDPNGQLLQGPAATLTAELVDHHLVAADAFSQDLWITRYRGWLRPSTMDRDLELVPQPGLPEVELALKPPSGAALPLLVFGLGGWLRRRRDRSAPWPGLPPTTRSSKAS